jgi:UDP-N-acetylmuramate--alanine ligase
MYKSIKHIHFVGIGGIGMSGIAEVLLNLGYRVSGSDMKESDTTQRLRSLGGEIELGHRAENVLTPHVVVISSAVKPDNVEVVAAREKQIPVIPRAEMLAELMRLKYGVAIAGAHGKTTTTSMVAFMLERAGLDPTAVIGGRLSAFGSNARLGDGPYMVVEADESDRSFLRLSPAIAVITNIDREHMEAYGSFDQLMDAFEDFASRVPFYGAIVACLDDPAVKSLRPRFTRPTITYGFDAEADVRGSDVVTDGESGRCQVTCRPAGGGRTGGRGTLSLPIPGRHNLQNALGAVAVGLELGVALDHALAALADFRGVERRYQTLGVVGGVRVIDDYGHHPTEIAAVLAAARDGRPVRLVAVFQPHRYTRTRDLLSAFGPALAAADVVVLTDIYPAGEAPLPGVTLEALADAVRPAVAELHVVPRLEDIPASVARLSRPGDLIVTLGAGSVGQVGDRLLDLLGREGRR